MYMCVCRCMYVCVYVVCVCVCVCMLTLVFWIYPRHKCRDSRQDHETRHEVSRLHH